jgi:5-methylcytosine-specific restriction endonuclease McrA
MKTYAELRMEMKKEQDRLYYLANKETIKTRNKKWQDSNPEKVTSLRTKGRIKRIDSKQKNGVYSVSKKFLKNLYSSNCFYCGSLEKIEADHVIPISRGGVHSEGNLVPACMTCNRSKSKSLLMEWKIRSAN